MTLTIEVKLSKKYTTTSLERFMEKFKSRTGTSYIIHPKEPLRKRWNCCNPLIYGLANIEEDKGLNL